MACGCGLIFEFSLCQPGMAQSGQFQFPDPERSRGREPRQLPLTLLDQVSDNSLLVSVELNGVVYQGVLFARQNRPDSPKSNEDYWLNYGIFIRRL